MLRIGIALGSGSARGWSHIGVLRALAEMGIHPEIVCGCSVGSIVGAAYTAGNLGKLEQWVLSLDKLQLVRFFELNATLRGFVRQDKLQEFFDRHVCPADVDIAELEHTLATVATNLENGREIWFTEGGVLKAVWASIALPGLFPPYRHNEQWLLDGGLVNPVPVSLCRALGADVVIAVNLNGSVARRYARHAHKSRNHARSARPVTNKIEKAGQDSTESNNSLVDSVAASLREYSAALFPDYGKDKPATPGLMDAIATSINIMQDKITRSRMAGDPPEILLSPRLEAIGLLEFYRAGECIAAGRDAVKRMEAEIRYVLGAD